MNIVALREQLIRHEGYAPRAYLDTVGKITIGVGHNASDVPLSDQVIRMMLDDDIRRAIDDCQRLFPNWEEIPGDKQQALCNMMFNLGYYRLGGFRQMRAAIEKGFWNAAADEMENSKWYRQVGKRGEELVKMMRA